MKSKKKRVREITDYIKFVFPMLILYILFFILPLFQTIGYSFTDYNGINPKKEFTGLTNYFDVFQDKWFYNSMAFTGKSVLLMILLANVLGFLLALALNTKIRSRNILRAIVFCPFVFNNVTVGFIWQFLLGRFMTDLYPLTGWKVFNIGWLSDNSLVLYSVVFVKLWQSIGYFMVIYLAGLQNVPQMYLEAAEIDGANSWQRFRHITFPLLLPSIASAVVLNLIGGLKLYDVIVALSGGGPGFTTHSLASYISNQYFKAQNAGYSAAVGIFTFFFIMIVANIFTRYFNKKEVEM